MHDEAKKQTEKFIYFLCFLHHLLFCVLGRSFLPPFFFLVESSSIKLQHVKREGKFLCKYEEEKGKIEIYLKLFFNHFSHFHIF